MHGYFISFEGGEGAGKSSQIHLLSSRLAALGVHTVRTREPGGSQGAERIRELLLSGAGGFDPLAEALLFAAARADHVQKLIAPAIRAGSVVLSDRFFDSTTAYQGAGSTVSAAIIADLNRVAVGSCQPDLTIILDIDPEVGIERAGRRNRATSTGADRFEIENLEFHRRVRAEFLSIAKNDPGRCAVVDASMSFDQVAAAVWAAVMGRRAQWARERYFA